MYTTHFGLSKRLFPRNPRGDDVFVGPQTASVMSALKKALAPEDAVITVSGPAGVGKSTIVRRALENIGSNRIVVSVGRLQPGRDEVIELLLAGLGARQMPKGLVHRFALFRRMLHQYGDKGTRVFIVVEDAARVGHEALSELEALTAEDSGASAGASIVLMGTEGLAELLRSPELVRLKQRVRLRQVIKPLPAGELRGYLKHNFRIAGGDFDAVFDSGCADALQRLSDGIPRLVNNIVEQALNSAAENGTNPVPAAFVEKVAAEEIGLTVQHRVGEISEALGYKSADDAESSAVPDTAPEPAAATLETARAVSEPAETPAEILPPVVARKEKPVAAAVPPEPAREPRPAASAPPHEAIPDLIQDTMPGLEVLPPTLSERELASATLDNLFRDDEPADDVPLLFSSQRIESPSPSTRKPDSGKASAATAGPQEKADLPPVQAVPAAVKTADEVPPWERDPTLAELRPDLEALERAMALAQGNADDGAVEPRKIAEPEIPELVPEITLDREIQAKIDEATEALMQSQAVSDAGHSDGEDQSVEANLKPSEMVQPIRRANPAPAAEAASKPKSNPSPSAAQNKKQNGVADNKLPGGFKDTGELQRVASGLAQAKSLEDVDDKMAETLFGEEFSAIAAEIAASVNSGSPANDELRLADEPATPRPAPAARKNGSGRSLAKGTNGPHAPPKASLDPAASERLKTVRELNNGAGPTGSSRPGESIVIAASNVSARPRKPEQMPQSIEDQISTSLTATLKTLKIPPAAPAENDDDDDDTPKRGFFSRFKRP